MLSRRRCHRVIWNFSEKFRAKFRIFRQPPVKIRNHGGNKLDSRILTNDPTKSNILRMTNRITIRVELWTRTVIHRRTYRAERNEPIEEPATATDGSINKVLDSASHFQIEKISSKGEVKDNEQ